METILERAGIDWQALQWKGAGGSPGSGQAGLAAARVDAGLRLGEATALRWEDCTFGRDANDTMRSLRIQAIRSRGVHCFPSAEFGHLRLALNWSTQQFQ